MRARAPGRDAKPTPEGAGQPAVAREGGPLPLRLASMIGSSCGNTAGTCDVSFGPSRGPAGSPRHMFKERQPETDARRAGTHPRGPGPRSLETNRGLEDAGVLRRPAALRLSCSALCPDFVPSTRQPLSLREEQEGMPAS